jgi:TonB-linked SusC/RagA family outer membrane protein
MKKNLMKVCRSNPGMQKLLVIMRLTFFLTILATLSVTAGSAQKAKLNLNYKNKQIKFILEQIEEQSDYYFMYNNRDVDVTKKVDLNVRSASVSNVLSKIFDGSDVTYTVLGKHIMIHQDKERQDMVGNQQKQKVAGVVVDENGEPLPGVSIVVKGTTIGITSDIDGKFSLEVDAKTILQFSFVGMEMQEVEVANRTNIKVVLQESAIDLDEVVAVGYQTKRKTNLTGSVATISNEQLKNRPVQKLSNLMIGLAPGLNVSYSNPGRVGGGGVSFNIGGTVSRRGVSPLLVVDGVVQESINALDFINPNDVENISVLKDAEAVIYGSRGSGGVLVVTTKRGKEPSVRASISTTFSTPRYYSRKEDMYTFFTTMRKAWEEQGDAPMFNFKSVFDYMDENNIQHEDIFKNDFKYEITDGGQFPDSEYLAFGNIQWYDFMYGTATRTNYDVSVSGSGKNTNYYLSGGVVDENSMLKHGKNDALTYFTRIKYEYNHKDYLKLGVNVGMRYRNLTEPTYLGAVEFWSSVKHTYDLPYTKEGRYNTNFVKWYSPLALAEEGGEIKKQNYNISPQFYVEVKPFSGMMIKGNVTRNVDVYQGRSIEKRVAHYNGNEKLVSYYQTEGNDKVNATKSINNSFIGNLQATYKVNIDEKHTIRSLVGMSHEEFYYDELWANRKDLINDDLYTLWMGNSEEQYNGDKQWETVIKSYFGNVSYSYKDRYTIEGNIRHDGSSRFIKGKKWDTFLGGGAAWNISEEPFFKNWNIQAIDFLKLRASWGELGNQNSTGRYDFASTIRTGTSGYVFGNSGAYYNPQYATTKGFPAVDQTWEKTQRLNVGAELTMFENRLNIAGNVFSALTDNMFYTEDFPEVLGTTGPQVNGASVKANGWDLSIKWQDKIGTDFSYSVNFGISDVRSKVERLSDSRVIRNGLNRFVEGEYVNSIYGLDFGGFFQTQEELDDYLSRVTKGVERKIRVGDTRYLDKDGDGVLEANRIYKVGPDGKPTEDSGDLVKLGERGPRYRYHINLNASWKGFTFSMLLNGIGQLYNWQLNSNGNGPAALERDYDAPWRQPLDFYYGNTWTPENPDALYPRLHIRSATVNGNINGHNFRISNAPYFQKSVPYLAIKNVQLGYNLPKSWAKKVGTERLHIYVSASDIGYLINKMPTKSFSPEFPFSVSMTPIPSTVSVGLNVNF